MSWDAPQIGSDELSDTLAPRPVVSSERVFDGLVFDVRRDHVDLGDGVVVTRDYLDHPGAVAIVPWRERDGRAEILMIRQYRHAVRSLLWELPAGLLDVSGEPAQEAAARELAEETDLQARTWHVLADDVASPGILPEWIRIFLARDLEPVPEADRHAREGEEAHLLPRWVWFEDAVTAALTGRIHNAATVAGILAADAHHRREWRDLRPGDAPWPHHPAFRDHA